MKIDSQKYSTPAILVIGFNRPAETTELFKLLSNVKPSKIYFAVDGPRSNKQGEFERVKLVQDSINNFSFECVIETLFRDKNLGCKQGVASAISWAFESEEKLIILEDDIRPNETFFPFVTELLEKYSEDSRVLAISGSNFLPDAPKEYSYRFSTITHVWGWATWKRAWDLYTPEINWKDSQIRVPDIRRHFKCSLLNSILIWRIFKRVATGKIDTWDYQLTHMALKGNYLAATSNVNLTDNAGFGVGATHTVEKPKFVLSSGNARFPLKHPPVARDLNSDRWIIKNAYGVNLRAIGSFLASKIKK